MAANEVGELEPETGRDLCRVRKDGERRGYRKDILTENMSERDKVFVCNRCQGMMREVCISTDGEQFCSCCKEEDEQTNPNLQMDNVILSFKCSCPLMVRGCGWLGTLANCGDHLDTCDYVHERCVTGCGVVMCRENMAHHLEHDCDLTEVKCKLGCGTKLTRIGLKTHMRDKCKKRKVTCKHCLRSFEHYLLRIHFNECPRMKIPCSLCDTMMCRESILRHNEQNCPEKKIECLFAEYNCEVKIKRKDLSQHLEENRIVHVELKVNALEAVIKRQNETIGNLNKKFQSRIKR